MRLINNFTNTNSFQNLAAIAYGGNAYNYDEDVPSTDEYALSTDEDAPSTPPNNNIPPYNPIE